MDDFGAPDSLTKTAFSQREQFGMEGNTQFPVVEELAMLVERAERACRTTAQLVRDFNFIVVWYQSRPRRNLRADPILDESNGQTEAHNSPCAPLSEDLMTELNI
jgi:hypothetical protein